MNIRTLPSWRQKDGTHTEILFYEMNGDEGKAIANESSGKADTNANDDRTLSRAQIPPVFDATRDQRLPCSIVSFEMELTWICAHSRWNRCPTFR